MKVHFDEQSDAVYFRLDDSRIVESEEVKPDSICARSLRVVAFKERGARFVERAPAYVIDDVRAR